MAEIRVVNKHHIGGRPVKPEEGVTRAAIYRGTPLGNPFVMKDSSLSERNRVCESYEEWIKAKLLQPSDQLTEVIRLVKLAQESNRLELVCFCAPKRCHGDTIKNLILEKLSDG